MELVFRMRILTNEIHSVFRKRHQPARGLASVFFVFVLFEVCQYRVHRVQGREPGHPHHGRRLQSHQDVVGGGVIGGGGAVFGDLLYLLFDLKGINNLLLKLFTKLEHGCCFNPI